MPQKVKRLHLSCYLEVASSSLGDEGIEISSCKNIQMKHKNLNKDKDFYYECMYLNFIQPFLLLAMANAPSFVWAF